MATTSKSKAELKFFEMFSGLFLVFLAIVVLFVAFISNQSIFAVGLGFLPTLIAVLLSLLFFDASEKRKKLLWFIPLLVVSIFYIVGSASDSLAQGLDVEVLSAINFLLAMIYIGLMFSFFGVSKKPKKVIHKDSSEKSRPLLQEYVSSIEDKAKAINFAIGRVYSSYHGGSQELRNQLRIPKEWYNEFSFIGVEKSSVDMSRLQNIISKIEDHLTLFTLTEHRLFGKQALELKNLIRDPKGKDRIIDVLDHNDKDPVRSYYEGAVFFCNKIKEEIEQRELKIVKNTYIPKVDEEKSK